MYMLDTDTSSYIIRQRPESVRKRFGQLQPEQVCISIITYAELLDGVERSSSSKINRAIVDNFARHLVIRHWDEAAAEHYAPIRTHLETNGIPIGGMDMQIAAHARSLGAVLVTNNTRHFERVEGLVLENWV
ncbi:MAG: type II toxin-antitoxin system VapC family toxin [Thiothrix sp.]|nr:type II toxin-antitoxin system VapC family toxin [Thiothrix sp.]